MLDIDTYFYIYVYIYIYIYYTWNLGFTNPDAVEINTRTIHRNHELYKMYTDVFPFLSTGDDENRMIAKTSVIQVRSIFIFYSVRSLRRHI